jgi:hypothetical protein
MHTHTRTYTHRSHVRTHTHNLILVISHSISLVPSPVGHWRSASVSASAILLPGVRRVGTTPRSRVPPMASGTGIGSWSGTGIGPGVGALTSSSRWWTVAWAMGVTFALWGRGTTVASTTRGTRPTPRTRDRSERGRKGSSRDLQYTSVGCQIMFTLIYRVSHHSLDSCSVGGKRNKPLISNYLRMYSTPLWSQTRHKNSITLSYKLPKSITFTYWTIIMSSPRAH